MIVTCDAISPGESDSCLDSCAAACRFDHHCPWVGNCVGQVSLSQVNAATVTLTHLGPAAFCVVQANYQHFIRFLLLAQLIVLFAIGGCIADVALTSLAKDVSGMTTSRCSLVHC